jgi:hypothetical protein
VALLKNDGMLGDTRVHWRMDTSFIKQAVSGWTIAYWHKGDTVNSIYLSGFQGGWDGHLHNMSIAGTMWIQGGASEAISFSPPGIAGQWHHYTAALDFTTDDTLYAWSNGNPNSWGGAVWNHNPPQFVQSHILCGVSEQFNAAGDWSNTGATGHFDNVRIYKRVLKNSEVWALAQQPGACPHPDPH